MQLVALILLATGSAAAAGNETCSIPSLDNDALNQCVVKAEYAVRGRLLNRAMQLEADLAAGKKLPFDQIVRCNIGNPQALGQRPLTFVRQTLSLLMNTDLMNDRAVAKLYPADVISRAKEYIAAVPSVGAYSDSQGVRLVREHVAQAHAFTSKPALQSSPPLPRATPPHALLQTPRLCAQFITERDGYAADAADIFLTDGASAGVKALMTLLTRGPGDAVLAPIPQYPLYSATATLLNGSLVGYYLDEAQSWGASVDELRRAVGEARAAGKTPRALAVINPGNPTGQSMPAEVVEKVLTFAAEEGLVLMADEVYQENIYGKAPPFTSFRKALHTLRARGEGGDARAAELSAAARLVSFHSTSKGFIGECGLRGGYFELQGFPGETKTQLLKLASISLCANVPGQFATGLMVKPPKKGEPSFKTYAKERGDIMASLERRANRIADALNKLPGVTCNAAEGAMYLFPQLQLPAAAIAAAAAQGMPADEFYCLRLLEATGLVAVPGSGFGQVDGTYHFRTTFLPPEKALDKVLKRLSAFQKAFMKEFAA